ncbi:MAG: copper chaperone PCu(A)C [Caulobacteraceae bacterium]|nr:copper chaperone PCu(A)C [Caulobacteraceae bacterium]
MLKFASTAALALAMTTAPLAASAHGYTAGDLKIGQPWSRPTPPGAPTAAGYLTLTNTGRMPETLLGGASPEATTLDLHQSTMAGGVMRMRPVTGGVVIAPGQTVKLEPGGYHFMFVGPRKPFAVGDHIPATLRFKRAGKVKVEFNVQEAAPEAAGGPAGMDMGIH